MIYRAIKYFLCSVAVVLIVNPAFAQQPNAGTAKATADSAAIKIGEQFHLNLQVNAHSGLHLVWAEIPDSFNHFLVVDRGKIDTSSQQGKNIYRQQITLTSFDSGAWHIPALDFKVILGDSAISSPTLITDSLLVQVNTVPVDTTKPFKPIKQIRRVPFNILAYWPYLLGGLVVLLLLIYFVFFRKKKIKIIPEKIVPEEPPYEEAVKSLHQLEEEKLWQHNEVKAYYTRLTDILRRYIERQFNINAMEQTSDEILQNIKPVTKLNQQQNNLKYILQTADLAKFAKLQPAREEHEASMKKAYEVLEWTKPKPEGEAKDKEDKKDKNTQKE